MRTTPRPLLLTVYGALYDVAGMRDDLTALRADLSEADAARLMARLDFAEGLAVQLLDGIESRRSVVAH